MKKNCLTSLCIILPFLLFSLLAVWGCDDGEEKEDGNLDGDENEEPETLDCLSLTEEECVAHEDECSAYFGYKYILQEEGCLHIDSNQFTAEFAACGPKNDGCGDLIVKALSPDDEFWRFGTFCIPEGWVNMLENQNICETRDCPTEPFCGDGDLYPDGDEEEQEEEVDGDEAEEESQEDGDEQEEQELEEETEAEPIDCTTLDEEACREADAAELCWPYYATQVFLIQDVPCTYANDGSLREFVACDEYRSNACSDWSMWAKAPDGTCWEFNADCNEDPPSGWQRGGLNDDSDWCLHIGYTEDCNDLENLDGDEEEQEEQEEQELEEETEAEPIDCTTLDEAGCLEASRDDLCYVYYAVERFFIGGEPCTYGLSTREFVACDEDRDSACLTLTAWAKAPDGTCWEFAETCNNGPPTGWLPGATADDTDWCLYYEYSMDCNDLENLDGDEEEQEEEVDGDEELDDEEVTE